MENLKNTADDLCGDFRQVWAVETERFLLSQLEKL